MKQDLVSIILPVYNAGEYLNQIFQDILNQSYQDIEIIVVDDGSTDNSWNVIQQFSREDSRICAVQQENGGPSKARNRGLQMASGKYIRFVDADDRVPMDSVHKMVALAQKSDYIDMVIGNYLCMPERNYFKGDDFNDVELDNKEFVKYFVKNMKSFYYGVTWNKLYKKDIIDKYFIRFDENIDWCEDLCFNLDYYSKCQKIFLCKQTEGVYIYCPRKDSITGSLSAREKEKLREIDDICYEKVVAYCRGFGLEQIVSLEWKYYNLYYKLSEIASKREKHSIKYSNFKAYLCQKDVQDYMQYKKAESKLWKVLLFVSNKKLYRVIYVLFWLKGVMVDKLGRFIPKIKNPIQKFLPKVL